MRKTLALTSILVACGPSVSGANGTDGSSSTSSPGAQTGTTSTSAEPSTSSSSATLDTTGSSPDTTGSSSGAESSGSAGTGATCGDPPSCESCVPWDDEYAGLSEDNDRFENLTLHPGGGVIAAGTQDLGFLIGGNGDARIARYSDDGVLLWAEVISAENGSFQAESTLVEDDGSILVALEANPNQDDVQTWLVRLGADGGLLGEPQLVADVAPRTLMRIGGETVLHSYERFPEPGASQTRLDRLEGTTLTPLLPSGSFATLLGRDVEVSAAPGGVLVSGQTVDGVPTLARAEPQGAEWSVAWSVDDFDFAPDGEARIAAAAEAEDGSVLFAALTSEALVAGLLGPDQVPIWTREQDTLSGSAARPQVMVDPAGRMFLASLQPGTSTPIRIVTLSACDGSVLWTSDYGEGSMSIASLIGNEDMLFAAGGRSTDALNGVAWVLGMEL